MSGPRAIAASLVVAVCTVVAVHVLRLADFAVFCVPHRNAAAGSVVTRSGFGVPRAGDRVFACHALHCFGPWPRRCHDDLDCYCAPPDVDSPPALERWLKTHWGTDASCTSDAICPPSYCTHLVDQ
ncbi:MAG: hypothetical protein LC659_09765 [Myxococcales bacterium]|nr:hypothetical protein [Myxococcales bacterium]